MTLFLATYFADSSRILSNICLEVLEFARVISPITHDKGFNVEFISLCLFLENNYSSLSVCEGQGTVISFLIDHL